MSSEFFLVVGIPAVVLVIFLGGLVYVWRSSRPKLEGHEQYREEHKDDNWVQVRVQKRCLDKWRSFPLCVRNPEQQEDNQPSGRHPRLAPPKETVETGPGVAGHPRFHQDCARWGRENIGNRPDTIFVREFLREGGRVGQSGRPRRARVGGEAG